MNAADPARTRRPRPTLADVAARAGVSVGTVQYVLSGNSRGSFAGSAATRERVLKAAKALDYRPNRLARATRTGRSQMVLLSMTHLDDPWTTAMAEAVDERARANELQALVLPSLDWYDALVGNQFDAAFLTRVERDDRTVERLRRLADLGVRLVVLASDLEPDGYDVLCSDAAEGTRLATEHVIDRRDIAYLSFYGDNDLTGPNGVRHQAFFQTMADAGLQTPPDWVLSGERRSVRAMQSVHRLLTGGGRQPKAIVADSAVAAQAAQNAALMAGVRVPDDLAIIGVGDLGPSQLGSPAVATAHHGHIFQLVSELVVRHALGEGEPPGQLHELPWQVDPRDTA